MMSCGFERRIHSPAGRKQPDPDLTLLTEGHTRPEQIQAIRRRQDVRVAGEQAARGQ